MGTTKRAAGHLLDGIDASALSVILAEARERSVPAATVLFRTGEPAERLFLVRRGSVRFGRVSSAGREVVMGVLTKGDVCGLGSLIADGLHYYGTAVTLESSELLVWNYGAIQRLAVTYPTLSMNALRVALNYVAHFIDRQLQLVSSTAEQRLAGTLIKLGNKSGNPTPNGIELAVTNELLASLADVSPFTTSRTMQVWTRSGAITKSRGLVRITAPEKLIGT
jgi:CRP-like cAMP-binding protein